MFFVNLLGLLEFLSASNALGLVLGTPHLSLSIGLAQLPLEVSLGLGFLLNLLAHGVQVVLNVPELAKEGSAFLKNKIQTFI